MNQKIEPLNNQDRSRLDQMRIWVSEHYSEEARHRLELFDGKIFLIETILKNGGIDAGETLKLQSLGAVFGDALVQRLGLEWVAVEDIHGRDFALRDPLTTVIIFPITVISKRVERGEIVDVSKLLEMAVESVSKHRRSLPGGGQN